MDKDITKTVVILTDHKALSMVLELELKANLNVDVIAILPNSAMQQEITKIGRVDLIIVVPISATSEPLVILAKAALSAKIGQVPLLIISDRPFSSVPDNKIFHLEFPFALDRVSEEVQRLLESEA